MIFICLFPLIYCIMAIERVRERAPLPLIIPPYNQPLHRASFRLLSPLVWAHTKASKLVSQDLPHPPTLRALQVSAPSTSRAKPLPLNLTQEEKFGPLSQSLPVTFPLTSLTEISKVFESSPNQHLPPGETTDMLKWKPFVLYKKLKIRFIILDTFQLMNHCLQKLV